MLKGFNATKLLVEFVLSSWGTPVQITGRRVPAARRNHFPSTYLAKTNTASPADHIQRLQNAILRLNHCESKFVGRVIVSESFLSFETTKLWRGEVAIFEIYGHPQARRAYAWSYAVDKDRRYVVVLEIPPVNSPQTAVQAAIAAQIVNGTFC
jgi:hypothetical protein